MCNHLLVGERHPEESSIAKKKRPETADERVDEKVGGRASERRRMTSLIKWSRRNHLTVGAYEVKKNPRNVRRVLGDKMLIARARALSDYSIAP